MNTQSSGTPKYHVEAFSDGERKLLAPYFTNLDSPVFALQNLSEVVKGALFARYSRSPYSLRRLFIEEFVTNPELGIKAIADGISLSGHENTMGARQAESLYRRIFSDYGDDSVAQLGGAHLACEQASNILTKILERGRLAAYLEQSTRYIRYDEPLGAGWRYFVPPEIAASEKLDDFCRVADELFRAYSETASALTRRFEVIYPNHEEIPAVWRATLRAKACDIARGLLPLATKSNVGVYANGQAFESMIHRMRSHPLEEARSYSDLMLRELKAVIPAFMSRVDVPEKGGAIVEYLKHTRDMLEMQVVPLQIPATASTLEYSVTLVDWDADGESRILTDILFSTTNSTISEIRALVSRMSNDERSALFEAYIGERANRRHKPGRAFESASYQFEVTCDYANFRDLQRHRLLTIEWQRASPSHGFTIPEIVATVNLSGVWENAINSATCLYKNILDSFGADVAQYVLPFCSKIRFYLRLNAREAMHLIELRTARGGHTQYRQVCQQMLQQISEKANHKCIARAMSFADLTPEYEFSRIDSERRAEEKRSDASLR